MRASFGHIEDAIVALRGSADGSVPSVVNQAADGHLLPNANARSLSRSASSGIGSMAPDSVTGNVGNVNVKANAVLRKSGPFSTDNDTDTDTDRATRAERSERGDSGYRGEREEARNKAKYPFQYRFNDHHVDLSQEQGQSELEPFIKDNLSESAKQEIVSSISNSNENENEIESGTYLYPPSNSVYSYSSEGGEYNVDESNTDLSTNVTSRTAVTLDSVGVVAIVTPWSWPLNQLLMKIAPALAAGCCVVVKPSEKCPGIRYVFDSSRMGEYASMRQTWLSSLDQGGRYRIIYSHVRSLCVTLRSHLRPLTHTTPLDHTSHHIPHTHTHTAFFLQKPSTPLVYLKEYSVYSWEMDLPDLLW